ncbi:receptor-like protein kinase [Musa troglodytarum]|uniref:non-specific serine/threonine protein kinase n=1 Tax=Musa troglodytarum TaxID=320322 RepID=A0A9E7JAK8_9LILI|nr:receptor-like protein kinase [Musa troglodytarum]
MLVLQNQKYLIRTTFMYGNYDHLNSAMLLFDLHLDANYWQTVNITDASAPYRHEAITVAMIDFMSICLVNTGHGIPFISALEMRPLKNTIYPIANASRTLILYFRGDAGSLTNNIVRYPDDPYDRIWIPWSGSQSWTTIYSNSTVRNNRDFEAPSTVMQTALTTVNSNQMQFSFSYVSWEANVNAFFSVLYFSEVLSLTGNSSRQFNIYLNNHLWYGPYSPQANLTGCIYDPVPQYPYGQYNYTIIATSNSTLPPLLNAIEVYFPMQKKDVATNSSDGAISTAFASLIAIEILDLSNNNLTGTIPDDLGNLPSLRVLNLKGNNLTRLVPDSINQRENKGQLTFIFDHKINPQPKPVHKISTPVIVVISAASAILLLVLVALCVWGLKRNRQGFASSKSTRRHGEEHSAELQNHENPPAPPEGHLFTYPQLVKVTNNFITVIGKGGFGNVYHGCLENGIQVAVKLRSQLSPQGVREFLAEVQNLIRVHHRNLVSLIGYCNDGNSLALVYEYMPRGSLQEYLKGKVGLPRLAWTERLRIAYQAAQGLDYLHRGCSPSIVHRDVKSSNILLGQKLENKLADFGLSKTFLGEYDTHVSTRMVVGTPGYVDPMYHNTLQINTKIDVYSFGVVLLELITGRPPIVPGSEDAHITQWVSRRLQRGNIDDFIDGKLQGDYDANSVWKVIDLAMRCTTQSGSQRPPMAEVVIQLKESLELETAHDKSESLYNQGLDTSQTSAFGIERVISGNIGPSAR